jgi:coenzyme F420 hydrogenase subunit gamma
MELLNSIKKTIGGEAKPAHVATEKKVEATKE